MKKPVILIKIGGSLITDKNKPFTLNKKAIEVIAKEVKRTLEKTDKLLVIGHGGGSFPHVPAKKYQTHRGVINKDSLMGIAEVQQAAARLNRIIVTRFLKENLPAVSINPLSCCFTSNKLLKTAFFKPVEQLLTLNMLPVLYGDVVLDEEKGCTILSTERVLGFLGRHLIKQGFKIKRIIHCGQTEGVYNQKGETIPLINQSNFKKYRKSLGGSEGIDVTGGMLHKVKQSLQLAQTGIPALIIDGIKHGTLSKAVAGQPVVGTRIES